MINDIGISLRGKIILVTIGMIFISFIFALLKKRKITESLALIWLGVSVGMIIVVSSHSLLMWLTHSLGAKYPASALTMIGLLFVISLLLYFTLQITSMTHKQRQLIQELGIQNIKLEERLQRLEGAIQKKSGDG